MRVLASLVAMILVFMIGGKTEWLSVSRAEPVMMEDGAHSDRAFEAFVLGQTRADATSGELIDAAVFRGEISSEQALLYGVYLACGDARLPALFRGQDSGAPVKNILWEADVDWSSLSPDIRQSLHTFFTVEAAAQPGITCASDIDRLKSDPSVWWARAVQPDGGQPVDLPALVATH